MKQLIKGLAIFCIYAGSTYAAPQRINGSDTMAGLTRDLITTLGLGSGIDPYTMTPPHCPDADVLCYFGGGSGTGWTAASDARNTGQGINPSSRPIAQADQDAAHTHMLEFIAPVCEVAKDGIAILANSAGNGVLNKIKLTDVGNIFSCAQRADGTKLADTWDKIPGSDPSLAGLAIVAYTRDGVSGTTDVFTSRTHGLVEGTVTNFPGLGSPPDQLYWRHHPEFFHSTSCVRDILGDGATQFIGYAVANDPQAIGFAGLPALQTGNYALRVCDNVSNPCTNDSDFIGPSITTIENGTYYYARTLYLGRVQGYPDPTSYTLPDPQDQFHTAVCGDGSCDFLADHVASAGFFPAPRCYTP